MESERCDFKPRLEALVVEFVNAIGYRGSLSVSPAYYPYDDATRQIQYPNADYPGCYVFVSGDGQVKYIGKAARYLGNRIWAHLGRTARVGESETYPNGEHWLQEFGPNIAVHSIAVPEQHWWLALALEGFLTEQLLPEKRRV